MRVCLVLPGFSADRTDAFVPALMSFVGALSERVDDVVVFTLGHPYRQSIYFLSGATVHSLANRHRRGVARLFLWLELIHRARSEHRRSPFTLVHGFGGGEQAALATVTAALLRLPSIVSPSPREPATLRGRHGGGVNPLGRLAWRLATHCATVVACGSTWRTRQFSRRLAFRTATMPLGVDTTRFRPCGQRTGRRLLVASSLSAENDLATTLRAVALARGRVPDLRLDVAGMMYVRELRAAVELISSLGLESTVRFLGPVPHASMPGVYRRRDLLVHAPLVDEQGMDVLEALATGMPIVATDVGIAASLPETLAIRVPPGDPGALAEAIVTALSSPALARAAATVGVRLVQSRFSSERSADAFVTLYHALEPPALARYSTTPRGIVRRRAVRRRATGVRS